MTRSEQIIDLLKLNPTGMSCTALTHSIAKIEGLTGDDNRKAYLSGSVSAKLLVLISKGQVEKSPTETGPKGGAIYKIKKQ